MSYDSSDAATRLSLVRQAIGRCLVSQGYTNRQREQRMADLKTLRAMERELMEEVDEAATNSGSMGTIGVIDKPMW